MGNSFSPTSFTQKNNNTVLYLLPLCVAMKLSSPSFNDLFLTYMYLFLMNLLIVQNVTHVHDGQFQARFNSKLNTQNLYKG